MKNINTIVLLTGFCTLTVFLAASAYAEKGAESLVNLTKASRTAAIASQPAATAVAMHKCPKCTDTQITVVDKGAKVPNQLVAKVARHNCSDCNTKIATEGTGKAKTTVALHSCGSVQAAACCASN